MRYTAEDIRFTTGKDGQTLYAILLGWPESGKAVIKTLGSGSKHYPGEIGKIELLGSSEVIRFTRDASGLVVELPGSKPCAFAYSLKITPKPNSNPTDG